MACSPAHKQPTSPWDSECSRGYIRRSASTLLVSTYCKREGREITTKRRIMHIEDTMRPGRMLPTPIGSMPGILQLTCMLEQRVQSAAEDTL